MRSWWASLTGQGIEATGGVQGLREEPKESPETLDRGAPWAPPRRCRRVARREGRPMRPGSRAAAPSPCSRCASRGCSAPRPSAAPQPPTPPPRPASAGNATARCSSHAMDWHTHPQARSHFFSCCCRHSCSRHTACMSCTMGALVTAQTSLAPTKRGTPYALWCAVVWRISRATSNACHPPCMLLAAGKALPARAGRETQARVGEALGFDLD